MGKKETELFSHNKIKSYVENAWLGLGDISQIELTNPFNHTKLETIGLDVVKLMKTPGYLHYAAKILLDIELIPEQSAILEELWYRPFPMLVVSRGGSKSFLLAVLALLKCVLIPETKVVIVGAAFRQSKVIYGYMEKLWAQGNVLRSICSGSSGSRRGVDECTMVINDSWVKAIPLGTGEKIRGMRANILIADEFGSISPDIYETVVSGFAAVSADPIGSVKEASKRKALNKLGLWNKEYEEVYSKRQRNQSILSGTADYDFKHFADYWKRYKSIVQSRGDPERLREILGNNVSLRNFNWKDYSVIRIPYELIPEGFMDDEIVVRAKLTVDSAIYLKEYGACFVADSDGFFKRSLIESCVGTDVKPISLPSGDVWFDALTRGSPDQQYVFGIDPASEQDNFSIVILELRPDHNRVVHCWTTNRKDFKARLRVGMTKQHDFYGFCARKIRELMRIFPCVRIGCDAQGGGISIEEALHDPDKMEGNEIPIWRVVEEKPQETDNNPGLHILEMVQFARAEWTATANHGLRKDFEDKVTIFPRFDPITLELSIAQDAYKLEKLKSAGTVDSSVSTVYDTLEDCVMEIEELKNELCTIVMTRTGLGANSRDRWDVPEIRNVTTGRKGRLYKDRYSALVIANMLARQIQRTPPIPDYTMIGGFSHMIDQKQQGDLYQGPEWFTKGMNDGMLFGVTRK